MPIAGLHYPGFITSEWYTCWGGEAQDTNIQGFCSWMPFFAGTAMSVQAVAVHVLGAADPGGKGRIGLYADGGSGKPTTLITDFGQFDATVMGQRTITASFSISGLVWFAVADQVANQGALYKSFVTPVGLAGGDALGIVAPGWRSSNSVPGAFPANTSSISPPITPNSNPYRVFLQAA